MAVVVCLITVKQTTNNSYLDCLLKIIHFNGLDFSFETSFQSFTIQETMLHMLSLETYDQR